jgi:hypothetical protein
MITINDGYLIGTPERIQECGIEIPETARYSVDKTKVVLDAVLTDEQFAAVRTKTSIQIVAGQEVRDLMETPEWKQAE